MKYLLILLLAVQGAAMHVPRNIQSPFVAADFWTQWSSVMPRMTLCIKVTSKAEFGSEVVAFTSNTRNMTLPGHSGVTFYSSPGITPTLIEQSLDEPSNMELSGIYNADSFVQTDVLAGKWSFAEIEVFSVCWDNVNLGEFLHFRGNLGEFKDYGTYFTAEARGLTSRLSQNVDKQTQRLCRVKEFRDAECGHTALTVTIDAVVYNIVEVVEADGSFSPGDTEIGIVGASFDGNMPPENFYANGKMAITGGANNGLSREIAYNSAPIEAPPSSGDFYVYIQLKRPFPFIIEGAIVTDITLTAGCDRTIENCMLYDNIINRRAEDYVPMVETITRLPRN